MLALLGNAAQWVAAIAACVAAVTTGAALIVAFLGWRETTRSTEALARALTMQAESYVLSLLNPLFKTPTPLLLTFPDTLTAVSGTTHW